MLKELIAYIRFWYCVTVFLSCTLLFIPIFCIYLLLLPHKLKYRKQVSRISYLFFKFCTVVLWGVKFKFDNQIDETFEKPAIVIGNHQSMLDLIVVQALHPHIVTVTNQWVWKSPFFNYILNYIGHIPASGRDGKSAGDLIEARLKEGFSVFIFPEGTRTSDGSVGRFHRGAFEIAERLGVDIVGILIKGAYVLGPKNRCKVYSGTLDIVISRRDSYLNNNEPRFREICHEWHEWYKTQIE